MKNATSYQKVANACLVILWIGALLFCTGMLYYWHQHDSSKFKSNNIFASSKSFFVDQLLLSSKELELGETVNLININLKAEANAGNLQPVTKTAPERKLVYSRILEQKIKKISTQKVDGFTIKPLPQ